MVEVAFGVPMSGGVLCTLNTRLDINALVFCLQHSEAKVLIVDTEFEQHIALVQESFPNLIIIHATDPALTPTEQFGNMTYEELIASGTDLDNWENPLMNGMPLRSTTHQVPQAFQKAWCITIVVRL